MQVAIKEELHKVHMDRFKKTQIIMNKKKDHSRDRQGQQNNSGKKENAREDAFNPFDKSQNASNKEMMREEADAEQQRKEALTERD